MQNYLIAAIKQLKPNSEFVIKDNDYATIEWVVLEGKAPTQAEIDKTIDDIKLAEAEVPAAKAALLNRLGLTADEAKLLLS